MEKEKKSVCDMHTIQIQKTVKESVLIYIYIYYFLNKIKQLKCTKLV